MKQKETAIRLIQFIQRTSSAMKATAIEHNALKEACNELEGLIDDDSND